jgi:hypothetical protein
MKLFGKSHHDALVDTAVGMAEENTRLAIDRTNAQMRDRHIRRTCETAAIEVNGEMYVRVDDVIAALTAAPHFILSDRR